MRTPLLPIRATWRASRWALLACLAGACLNPQPDQLPTETGNPGGSSSGDQTCPPNCPASGSGGSAAGSGGSAGAGGGAPSFPGSILDAGVPADGGGGDTAAPDAAAPDAAAPDAGAQEADGGP